MDRRAFMLGTLLTCPSCLGDGQGELDLEALQFIPPYARLQIEPGSAARQTFRVEAIFAGGRREDVTSLLTYNVLDPALGTMTGAVFLTAGRAGSTDVVAIYEGVTGRARVDMVLPENPDSEAGGPLPPDPGSLISAGTQDNRLPRPFFVYPADGTKFPRNMPGTEVHFRANVDQGDGHPTGREYDYSRPCNLLPEIDEMTARIGGRTVTPDPADTRTYFPHMGMGSRKRLFRARFSVSVPGLYRFEIDHLDAAVMFISGAAVAQFEGTSSRIRTTQGVLLLSAGEHELILLNASCRSYQRDRTVNTTYGTELIPAPSQLEIRLGLTPETMQPLLPIGDVQYDDYGHNFDGRNAMPTTEDEIESRARRSWSRTDSTPRNIGAERARVIEGTIGAPETGEYEFTLRSGESARLYINGELVIDNWALTRETWTSARINLSQGSHTFRTVQIANRWARMELYWQRPSDTRRTRIDQYSLGRPGVPFVFPKSYLYQLRFFNDDVDITAHTRCRTVGGGLRDECLYTMTPGLWTRIASRSAGRTPLRVTVTKLEEDTNRVNTSNPIELDISAATIEGAVYYWDTNTQGIFRTSFGSEDPPEYYWPQPRGQKCGGCHTLAPNGEKLIVGVVDRSTEQIVNDFDIVDITSDTPAYTNAQGGSSAARQRGSFFAWHPSGDRFISTADGDDVLRIRNAETGEQELALGQGFQATHPDWSPDGRSIAFIDYDGGDAAHPERGRVVITQATGNDWSAPRVIGPREPGVTYTSPSFAPTADFLVVARSRCSNGRDGGSDCDGFLDPPGRLYAISTDSDRPIELLNANRRGPRDRGDGKLRYSYPKFSPFIDADREDGSGRVTWVMFSARRRYGARSQGQNNTLLWMAAIDPDAIAEGRDGSFAPFVFPNQDITKSNLHAFWARRLIESVPPGGGGDAGTGGGGDAGVPICTAEGESCIPGVTLCCGDLMCEVGTGTQPICQAPF